MRIGRKKKNRPGCFYPDTPLDGTMCPHKMPCEVTLKPSAESATIKVKVSLESGPLFSKKKKKNAVSGCNNLSGDGTNLMQNMRFPEEKTPVTEFSQFYEAHYALANYQTTNYHKF